MNRPDRPLGLGLALIADDVRLVDSVQQTLAASGLAPALVCRSDAIADRLGARSVGPLLVAASVGRNAGDGEALVLLLQALHLQRYPAPLVLVEGSEETLGSLREALPARVAELHSWPQAQGQLSRYLKERGPRLEGRVGHVESVAEIIHRKLENNTPSLLPMQECLVLAALHDVTVLLTGETGTGKTYLARLMHDCSARKGEPFLTVPCGAQPANLLESVFFGHVKGAFTGADRSKEGKFAAAGRGTILLDEIDTLPLEAQAGLLRVIETGEYEPVGSNQTQRCEARIIVASNWDLDAATRQGRFRTDLYYRLNVMSFHLPPLRERLEDIAHLFRSMAARCNTRFRKSLWDIRSDVFSALEGFAWPGNLRQLENVAQQSVLVSKTSEMTVDDLPIFVLSGKPAKINGHVNGHESPEKTLEASREQAERVVIQRALEANHWNRTRTASVLGISRVTLFKKMKKHRLSAPRKDLAHENN